MFCSERLLLRFGSFAITRRGLTDPLDGFGLKRPMARDRHPAFFRIFGPPSLAPYYMPICPVLGHPYLSYIMGPFYVYVYVAVSRCSGMLKCLLQ